MIKKQIKLVTLSLAFSFLLFNCSTSSDDSGTDDIDSSEYIYYVSGKINGEKFIYGQRKDDTTLNFEEVNSIPLEGATCAYSADQGLDYKISYGTSIYPGSDDENAQQTLGIDFLRFYRCSDSQSSTAVFNNLFTVGTYAFSIDDQSSGIMKQIGITYSPEIGTYTYYNSYGGTQSGSSFKITSSQEDNDTFDKRQIVEGEFSVKLYNTDDVSDVVEITEGKFKMTLVK